MNSIRRRLATGLLLGLLLLVGGGAVALYGFMSSALYNELDDRLLVEARAITTVTKQERTYIAVGYTDDRIVDFDDKTPTRYYQLWYPDGLTVQRSKFLPDRWIKPQFGSFEQPRAWNTKLPDGKPGRAVGVTFVPDVDSIDRRHYDPNLNLGLVVAGDRSNLERTLSFLRVSLLGGVSTIAVAIIALVLWVLRRSLRPLNELAMRAAEIDSDSLSVRFPSDDLPSELQPITARMNHLLDRLQGSFDRERQFSSDVAHELRTPVAELRALVEVAVKWPEQVDEQLLHDLSAVAGQMEHIVTALLVLKRSERHEESSSLERIPIRPLMKELKRIRGRRAEQRGINVDIAIDEGRVFEGDRSAVSTIVSNLFDNALEYTPAGGTIEIRAQELDGRTKLVFANPSDDLRPGDVLRIFDRFWRKSGSRINGEHLGLGLSLCKSLALANGWALSAQLQHGVITMTLSEAESPPSNQARGEFQRVGEP